MIFFFLERMKDFLFGCLLAEVKVEHPYHYFYANIISPLKNINILFVTSSNQAWHKLDSNCPIFQVCLHTFTILESTLTTVYIDTFT